jgi:hypothetical protein
VPVKKADGTGGDVLILGLLSLCQITFLPGFLLLRATDFKYNFIQRLVFSFAASLILNYVLVFFLTGLHLYTRPALLAIFCMETALLLYYRSRHLDDMFGTSVWEQIKTASTAVFGEFSSFVRSASAKYLEGENNKSKGRGYAWLAYAVQSVIICLVLYSLGWAITEFYQNIGDIFLQNDPIVSWNRWAVDWFHNRFPVNTYAFYPQLITANWSIAYVFVDYPLQYIPAAIMPLFFLYILLLMLDLAFLHKSSGYLLGIFALVIFFQSAFSSQIGDGYTDTAVAFMGFLSVYCLHYAESSENSIIFRKYIIWGGFFAAGTVVTKHSGLYILAGFSLLALILLLKRKRFLTRKDFLLIVFSFMTFIAVIDAPFFIMRGIELANGTNPVYSNYSVWNDKVLGSTYSERLHRGLLKLDYLFAVFDSPNNFPRLAAYLLSVLGLMFAFFEKKSRIFLLLGLGWWVLWSIYLSYDLRNLSIALPFAGLAIGVGLENIALADKIHAFAKKINVLMLTGLAIFAVILINFSLNKKVLIDSHTALEKTIGYPELNKRLYEYKNKYGINKKIISNYQLLNYLPEFKGMLAIEYFEPAADPLKELAIFHANLANPEVGFILAPEDAHKAILEAIESKVNNGDFERVFRMSGYVFLRINRDREGLSPKDILQEADFVRLDVKVDGLRGTEGPYDQWDLPQFRWAEKGSFILNFWSPSGKAVAPVELNMSFRPQVRSSARMIVKLNGVVLKAYEVGSAQSWNDDVLKLVPRKGINHIEFLFPGTPPPPDNLYMLFRRLSLRGRFST